MLERSLQWNVQLLSHERSLTGGLEERLEQDLKPRRARVIDTLSYLINYFVGNASAFSSKPAEKGRWDSR